MWTGYTNSWGYGSIHGPDKHHATHRLAWEVTFGSIPDGLQVLHRCDNPPCCNPLHLTGGTRLENNQQAWERGLHPTGERHHAARISWAEVEEIRARRAAGESQASLARHFNVHQSHISTIVNHKSRRAA